MRDKQCVLVADDESAIVDVVADILREEGYRVLCVYEGVSALHLLETKTPDLVLLDNMMPVMTGLETLRLMRAQGFAQPIIIMSAVGQAQLFLDDGATAFLPKPFSIELLLEVVAVHLGR
jgi:two-component system, OmpR family, response regulator VicR